MLSPFLYAFFIYIRPFFFWLFVFSYIIMYILNIARAIKKMSVNEIRDFIFKNYYKELDFLKKTVIIQWNTWKKWFISACKQIKRKIPDPRNVKERYQSFIRKKHTKLANQLKNNYLSTKNFWKPKYCWCKINYYRISKTSQKLSKTIRQAKKVGPNYLLYSDTKKVKIFETKKM